MRKRSNCISLACIIAGSFLIFEGLGGIALIREKLGMVTTYASDLEEFTLFYPDHLTSAQDLALEESSTANHFREMSTCHQTISKTRCYQILEKTYNLVPSFVIDTIYIAGFQIMMVGNDIRELVRLETNWSPTYYYDGVTFSGGGYGYTQIWSSSRGGVSVLIHEIGHAYDYSLNRPSSQETFQALFQSEAYKFLLINPYFCSNEREFFAESFTLYLTQPWILQLLTPHTFEFFDSFLRVEEP